MSTDTSAVNADTAVRPFHAEIADEAIADLRRRIAAWRPPEREPVDDQSQGVQLATVQDLADYWATGYDWRRCEANLNALPQFTTEIDGLDIHFIHVRSAQQDALPVILTHGWPGSVIEMLKVIEPLTNPAEHGGDTSDAFDVVIPSMPGYGFSARPAATGWGPERIGRAWAVLMERLGIHALRRPRRRLGHRGRGRDGTPGPRRAARHPRQLRADGPARHPRPHPQRRPPPADLSDTEKRAYQQMAFATYHRGYGVIQGTPPANDRLQPGRHARRPGRLAPGPRRHHLRAPHPALHRTPLRRHHPRRLARQHHAVLAHQHRGVRGPAVLAASRHRHELLRRRRRLPPGGSHGVPGGVRHRAARLDREGIPQPDLLPPSRTRRPLRRLGTTATVRRRAARGVPHTPPKESGGRQHPSKLSARADTELFEHLVQVPFDCAWTDEQSRSDLCVRQPLTGEPRDLRLMGR